MISYPNAKINIGLNILSKRADGFHEIESVFYPVNWKDILEIVPSGSGHGQVEFSSTGIDIPSDSDGNLCERAYRLLHADFNLPSVKIHLHKVIPIGAGLGGGSADATFTLKMLNDLFELQLQNDQLEKYAEQLGSDCPFFVENTSKLVKGRGEVMEPIGLDLSEYQMVLINPRIHIGTAEAYRNVKLETPDQSLVELMKGLPEEWKGKVENAFESSLFPSYRRIEELKNRLYEKGALYASMTGSGSTVYGIFDNTGHDFGEFDGLSVKVC